MSYTVEELRRLVNKENNTTKKLPKILIFDIETAPMLSYHWKRKKEFITPDQTVKESFMLCWSAKWLFEDKIFGSCVTPIEAQYGDDYRVVEDLYNTIDEADIIVAYNGENFDIPYMNQRFLIYGFKPYTPVQVIDSYKTIKYQFRFSSNKMDSIATQLHLQNKIKTDFSLWKGCVEGNSSSLKEMFNYNKQDIVVLEEIYLYILPWMKKHPNIQAYLENDGCVSCGSNNLMKLNKYYYTSYGKYELFKCKDCGKIFRGKKNLIKGKTPFTGYIH